MADDNVIITRHTKVVHKIYNKMHTLVVSTKEVVGEHNFALLLARVMRELNKTNLYGFEKKQLSITIMVLLLDSLGSPPIVSQMTAEAIAELVEFIYTTSMHRYKQKSTCIIN